MVVGSWRKSSYSGNNGGDCVEVGHQDALRAVVRSSQDFSQRPDDATAASDQRPLRFA